jgi:hypothetical protein
MARGKTFGQIVQDLRSELSRATDPSVGVSDLDNLKYNIRTTYETLWEDIDWPHLTGDFDKVTLAAGQRYYDMPVLLNGYTAGIDFERVVRADVWYSGLPHSLTRGISSEHYALFDSTTGIRSDPALRWDVKFTGVTEQIEIWPIPSSNSQSLQIFGHTRAGTLVNDADVLALDDKLVVLMAAASMLEGQGAKNAKTVASLAVKRMNRLAARMKSKDEGYRMGMGKKIDPDRYRAVVRVSGTS